MSNRLTAWINLAIRAPSGDNCQPWDLIFLDNKFRISINSERAHHFLDQDLSASWISIGCLCENLRLSSKSYGFQCSFEIESPTSVLVTWNNLPPESEPETILAIYERHTFRGKLKNAFFNLAEYKEHYKNISERALYEWQITPTVSKKLIWDWSWLETLLWLKTPLMSDFTKWLHQENEFFQDGITYEGLRISWPDKISLKVFKKLNILVKLVPFSLFLVKSYFRLNFLLKESAGLLSLSGPLKDYKDYFHAGCEIQRMWVFLTKKKIKSQPLSIQSLFLNFLDMPLNRELFSSVQLQRMHTIRDKTYTDLKINQNLIFSFRFGYSEARNSPLPRRRIQN
ncbi:MAG: hypothetical protein JNL11_15550 [Bdellovibrionaceae bacterium]|nr:hypothetical protein [Pseudobdellovibrionaceae bacterium]